ncbi:MAG: DUF1467 family protein [Alphaproteobacteria bacterium]
MSWFQFILTYLVSWWMVLFMVLPWGVRAPAEPAPGHAPSAPERPRLARKFAITTALAFVPAFLIMAVAGCAGGFRYLSRRTGQGRLRRPPPMSPESPGIAPATIDQKEQMRMAGGAPLSVDIPADPYVNGGKGNGNPNADLGDSYIHVGNAGVNEKGEATMNGRVLAPKDPTQSDCDRLGAPCAASFPVLLLTTAACVAPPQDRYCESQGSPPGSPGYARPASVSTASRKRASATTASPATWPPTRSIRRRSTARARGSWASTRGGRPEMIPVDPDWQHNHALDMLRMSRVIAPCMQAKGWNSGESWTAGRHPAGKPAAHRTRRNPPAAPTSPTLPWQ